MRDLLKLWERRTTREAMVADMAEIARRYGVKEVHRDNNAAGWIKEAFKKHGLVYVAPHVAARDHSPNLKCYHPRMRWPGRASGSSDNHLGGDGDAA